MIISLLTFHHGMNAQGNGPGNGQGNGPGGPPLWELDGNAISSGDFLGTTNAMPLELRTNGELRTVVLPDGRVRVLNTAIFRDSLTVEGHAWLQKDLVTGGETLLQDSLTVNGHAYLDRSLTVNGKGHFLSKTTFHALQYTDGSEQQGHVMTTDANGKATWSSPASVSLWEKNGNDLYYDQGNLGLGINNPQYLLDVNGDAAVRQDLLVGGSLEVGTELRVPKARYDTVRAKTQGGGVTYEDEARLMSGGCVMNENFGIGTETPGEKLTVKGNARIEGRLTADSLAVPSKTELGYTEVDSLKVGANSLLIGGQTIGSADNDLFSNDLWLQPFPWSEHVYLTGGANPDGKVFVGTQTVPSGTGFDPDFIVQGHTAIGDVAGTHGGNYLRMWCDQAHVNLASIEGSGGASGDLLINYYNENDVTIGGPDSPSEPSEPSDLLVNGNVGIETPPNDNYRLSVNGKIRSKEVIVETGWSDYVFEEGYDLPTLEDEEGHIEEKGYLKGFPSSGEVEKNGLSVGEMTKLQQQEIEELYLHLIEMKKEMEELREENKALRNKLDH